jgi:hypothetical protein
LALAHMFQVDRSFPQRHQGRLGKAVAADGAGHMDLSARPACGQCLVRALPARHDPIARAKDSLAGLRQLLHGHDEIDID